MQARFPAESPPLEQPEIKRAAAAAIAPAIIRRRFAICFAFRKVLSPLVKTILTRHVGGNVPESIGKVVQGHYPTGHVLVTAPECSKQVTLRNGVAIELSTP